MITICQNSPLKANCCNMQVGIVHEAMRFPLWLHGQTTITFLVVSTFPKNPIGKRISAIERFLYPLLIMCWVIMSCNVKVLMKTDF